MKIDNSFPIKLYLFLSLFFLITILPFATFSQNISNSSHTQNDAFKPRFASIASPKVNLRTGPGLQYPIEWVYKKVNYPVKIIDAFDVWRKIQDVDSSVGWIHQAMLSSRSFAIVINKSYLKASDNLNSQNIAILHPNVIVKVIDCPENQFFCKVEINNLFGFINKKSLWGVSYSS